MRVSKKLRNQLPAKKLAVLHEVFKELYLARMIAQMDSKVNIDLTITDSYIIIPKSPYLWPSYRYESLAMRYT